MNIKQGVLVINAERATELALAKKIVESHSRSYRDAGPELLPPQTTVVQGVNEVLAVCQLNHKCQ
jgi:hypothetical protein